MTHIGKVRNEQNETKSDVHKRHLSNLKLSEHQITNISKHFGHLLGLQPSKFHGRNVKTSRGGCEMCGVFPKKSFCL